MKSSKSQPVSAPQCGFPGCSQPAPLKCSRCKEVRYCSKEHQKTHWKIHKKLCVPPGERISSKTTPPIFEGRVRTGSQVEMAEGGIVVTMKLMPTTATKLINLTGFNMSKMKLEELGQLYLSGGWMTMEQFESFKKTSVQEDSKAKDIDELFAEAKVALPV